jgi:hypothetical protein
MSRIATFVLAIASWWLMALCLWGGRDALAYVLFFGSFYAVPMVLKTTSSAMREGILLA